MKKPGFPSTEEKLADFRGLKPGWHYGQGEFISQDALQTVGELQNLCRELGLTKTDVFPGLGGEVMFTIYLDGECLEFVVLPDLSVDYVRELGDKTQEARDGITVSEARAIISQFAAMP